MTEAKASKGARAESRRFLIFGVEARVYALPAETVSEVIHTPLVARVPQAPRALCGLANLRGEVLPLVSLRALLGLEGASDRGSSRAVVLDSGSPVAIAVDAVEALVTVDFESIETRSAELGTEPGEQLMGAFPLANGRGVAKILDVQRLLAEAFAQRTATRRASTIRGTGISRDETETAKPRDTLITFEVAGQEFALGIDVVQEIVAVPTSIVLMPRAEALVIGMITFREKLLPLLSLRGLLGFAQATISDSREKVVVTRVAGALVGLIADRARAIVSAESELVDPVPPVLSARAGGEARIKAIYRGDEGRRLISILAPEQLFREDVMQRLGSSLSNEGPDAQIAVTGEERKFLVFRLGCDEFGLPIEAVDEVTRVPDQITKVPKTPKFLEGVVNVRGEVVPVVDQRRRFDMPKAEGDGLRLVLVRTEQHRAGLIVDSVSQVLRTTSNAIEAPPDLTGDITRLVKGVINLEGEGRIVLILDPSELLTRAERGLLDTFKSKTQASP